MPKYIDADRIKELCETISNIEWNRKAAPCSWSDAYEHFEELVDEQPTEDVQEVKHGHWFFTNYAFFTCSVCRESLHNGCDTSSEARKILEERCCFEFCPHCGAKMDGDKE